ncbi:MAG: ABC transporter permease [Acidimicrobiia bacterium]|nr:ABC transporter permease [Acidimicrobiia bacterium]
MTDQAQIYDTGYRAYEGQRGGLTHAVWSTTRHGIERSLGIRRSIWQKVLPVLVIIIAFLPAIVFVGMAAFLGDTVITDELLPDYFEYYGFIGFAIFLFAAFVAPEVLCTDRRTGMLGLYLASPLDRPRYLLAKMSSVLIVMSIVTLGPQMLMFVAYSIVGVGPGGIGDHLVLFGRIVASGAVVTLMYTSLALMISSFTDRRAFASAATVIVLVVSTVLVNSTIETTDVSANLAVFDLAGLPFTAVLRIFGEVAEDRTDEVSTGLVLAACGVWTALFTGVLFWRYRNIRVRR